MWAIGIRVKVHYIPFHAHCKQALSRHPFEIAKSLSQHADSRKCLLLPSPLAGLEVKGLKCPLLGSEPCELRVITGGHLRYSANVRLECRGLSAFYGKVDTDEERFKASYAEIFYDSTLLGADIYGDSEELLGKWFQRTGKRSEIFLTTKFANKVLGSGGAQRVIDSSPEYCKEACEKSLKRLGVDYIDLYYCHRVDKKTPIEKTMQAMVELKEQGKIKYIGLSEVSAATIRRACAVAHVDAVQMEYSPFSLEVEQFGVLDACRELGVALVAYSPLGRGMLTGQYTKPSDFEEGDFRRINPRFSEENFPKNLRAAQALREIAERKSCTPGQLALAWLLAQDPLVIPIPGTKKVKYLEENVRALDVVLTDEEEKEVRAVLERAGAGAGAQGARYPEAMLSALFADTVPL
ncbi:hypothetical protein QFC21_000804 [Naganishia friedmannii]|uniref:Uncharacterized protein n=1 Tax=Naganishia friedmannii TaxID=89922 RepID=A0ACC2W810_9TREE|nr:hypothetical protein QFC21_000804 [Naganishia friedmannii]